MKNGGSDVSLTEKKFTRKISFSVALIVFAFLGMTVTAWAMFGGAINNIKQTISSANFYVESVVTKDGKAYTPLGGLIYETGEYTVTLNAKGSVKERPGFCKISVGGEETLYTPQMRTAEQKAQGRLNGYPDSVTFKLILHETAAVEFSASWSTYNPEFDEKSVKADGSSVVTYGTAPVEPTTVTETTTETAN